MDKSKIAELQARVDAFQAELDALKNPEPDVDWSKMAGRLVMVRDHPKHDWRGPFVYTGRKPEGKIFPHLTAYCKEGWAYATPYTGPTRPNWIEWRGGECPVDGRVYVLVQKKGGDMGCRPADQYRWDHRGSHLDIMRYTIIEP